MEYFWTLVVVATLWTIWLSRNEFVFHQSRISKLSLEQILRIRISKWGKASGIMSFGSDPLWHVNPNGAIAVHNHLDNQCFRQFKGSSFDFTCATDGAWGINSKGIGMGGIGGLICDGKGLIIHKFSGPYKVNSSIEAELGAIFHMAEILNSDRWSGMKSVIFMDSMEAIDLIKMNSYLCLNFLKGGKSLSQLINLSVVVMYVPRSLNTDTDSLDKLGLASPNLKAY